MYPSFLILYSSSIIRGRSGPSRERVYAAPESVLPGGILRGPQKYAFEGETLHVGRASTAGERGLTCGRAPLRRGLETLSSYHKRLLKSTKKCLKNESCLYSILLYC